MCIVFLAFQMNQDFPIMYGANREESCTRPMTLPSVNLRPVRLVAGLDRGPKGDMAEAGTWFGTNEHGLTVAVTNRDDGVLHGHNAKNSRGLLVEELLRDTPSVDDAASVAISSIMNGAYGGFNLLMADWNKALILHSKGPSQFFTAQLGPGLHVLTNLDLDDPEDTRIKYVKENLKAHDFENSASKILLSPEIMVEDDEWGTIASSILMLRRGPYPHRKVSADSIFKHVCKPQWEHGHFTMNDEIQMLAKKTGR
jgi:uncharacterized protein with NRDE domain